MIFIVAVLLAASVAALIAPRAPRLAVALTLPGLGAAWLLPADDLGGRLLLGLLPWVLLMKVVELRGDPRPAAARLFHLVAFYDLRRARRDPVRLDLRLWGLGLAWILPAALGFWLAVPDHPMPLRHLGLALGLYAVLEVNDGLLRGFYRLFGLALQPLQRDPALSRSLGEFWGRRWNRLVNAWLARTVFGPVARLGRPRLGLLAAFLVSGLIHAWPVLTAMGAAWAAPMFAFFVAHGLLVLVERPLGVARWPRWAGHAWTWTLFALTLPLFTAPILAIWR